jgi:hypothetical protein
MGDGWLHSAASAAAALRTTIDCINAMYVLVSSARHNSGDSATASQLAEEGELSLRALERLRATGRPGGLRLTKPERNLLHKDQ